MTEQEQIKAMTEKMKRCFEKNSLLNFKWFAEALVQAGYGDISEYKAEREMLGSQIKVLKQRLNNKYVEIERLKAENERFENNMKNVLKIEKRQAQIDVLNELKTRHDYAIKNMGYPWDISQQIDELIAEVRGK